MTRKEESITTITNESGKFSSVVTAHERRHKSRPANAANRVHSAHWYEKVPGRFVERQGEQVPHPAIRYLGCTLDAPPARPQGESAAFQATHLRRAGEQLVLR
jgi:hypothetical protein